MGCCNSTKRDKDKITENEGPLIKKYHHSGHKQNYHKNGKKNSNFLNSILCCNKETTKDEVSTDNSCHTEDGV